jgi:hypothetical protein
MISLVVVGLLVVPLSLFWGYVVLAERGGSAVVRGVVGTAVVTALLMWGRWLIVTTSSLLVVSGD